jgi:hypothetical protein
MSDPFSLPVEDEGPPRFEDAVRRAAERLQEGAAAFEAVLAELPEDALTAEEWSVIEQAAADIQKSAEMADEGYVAVAFDSHAWYRIMEHQERVLTRLQSALGIMRAARDRLREGSRQKGVGREQ